VQRLPMTLAAKLDRLRRSLQATRGCVVAYSGGVDSSLLLAVAREQLGDRCLAAIGVSPVIGARESRTAIAWLRRTRTPHVVLRTREWRDPKFRVNPEDRCYHCKLGLFRRMQGLASRRGLPQVAEGSNRDDRDQVRPGQRAVTELGILRPLDQAGLRKAEIRRLARAVYRLPMADKPSNPCLASRIAFGTSVTPERLRQVERMEDWLHAQGFRIFRARLHPGLLRLELGPAEERRLLQPEPRRACVAAARRLGFTQVTFDLQGFRSGSAHETARPVSRRVGSRSARTL